jgi:hypothetical protein
MNETPIRVVEDAKARAEKLELPHSALAQSKSVDLDRAESMCIYCLLNSQESSRRAFY